MLTMTPERASVFCATSGVTMPFYLSQKPLITLAQALAGAPVRGRFSGGPSVLMMTPSARRSSARPAA